MKVFGIGLNKTGTTSLHEALKVLGIRSLHSSAECTEIAREVLAGREPRLLRRYEAFLDGRLYEAYQELAERFPDARFVLTTRDKEAWMLSRINHVLFNRVSGESPWREIATRQWSDEWDAHHRKVKAFFERPCEDRGISHGRGRRPAIGSGGGSKDSSRCLTIDVCAGEGWEKLCPFLNKPIPERPFPRANQTKWKFGRLQACPSCKRPF